MTIDECSITGQADMGLLMKIVSVIETEICDMLSNPAPDMEEIGRFLRVRNNLLAQIERKHAETMDYFDSRRAAREEAR